jgi:NTE family protein
MSVSLLVALTCALGAPLVNQANELTKADESAAAAPLAQDNRSPSVLAPATKISEPAKAEFAEKRPRVVLALGGGAFKSVAQIGVIKSFEEHGIPIDGVVGTSLGATIGALYCAGMKPDQIEDLFTSREIQHAILSGVVVRSMLKPLAPIKHAVLGKTYPGTSTGKAYLKFLDKHLPESFKDLRRPFAAVTTNLTDGHTEVLSEGELPTVVLASSCVPMLMKPVRMNGKLYVDGGLRANLPSNIAKALGGDLTVSVLSDKAIKPVADKKMKNAQALMLRVTDIMMAAADHPKAASSDVLVYPDTDFMPVITKDPELIRRAVEAGRRAADFVIPEIRQELLATRGEVVAPKSRM